MSIVKLRKIWFSFSGILVGLSILSLIFWGLNLGIDFTGGSLLEIRFKQQNIPNKNELVQTLKQSNIQTSFRIQKTSSGSFIIRMKDLKESEHQKILKTLRNKYNFIEDRFDSVGPVIGNEMKQKALYSIIIVLIAIVLYIAWAFRKVSKIITSWKYGIIALIALFHDIIITTGVFSVLGHFYKIEVGLPFVAALLTILGYSVNDTIVVFDRIRENLIKQSKVADFLDTVDRSIKQTFTRSLNTSLTTLLVLIVVYIFGGESIKNFILALIIGISFGTYSSIFLASPLLISLHNFSLKKKNI